MHAVDDVSFSIRPREVLGIAGESGSGKSTIGRCVLRLIEPTSGEIRFAGRDVTQLDRRELRLFRRKAQRRIPEDASVNRGGRGSALPDEEVASRDATVAIFASALVRTRPRCSRPSTTQ